MATVGPTPTSGLPAGAEMVAAITSGAPLGPEGRCGRHAE